MKTQPMITFVALLLVACPGRPTDEDGTSADGADGTTGAPGPVSTGSEPPSSEPPAEAELECTDALAKAEAELAACEAAK